MFDLSVMQDAIRKYKINFEDNWKKEVYKWEAVKNFQDNWNVNAEDFAGMLKRSLSKAYNLLDSGTYYPARMINIFAQRAPEETREMFIELYDESKDTYERIRVFRKKASLMLEKYSQANNHYQTENSISVYLWLRYPDKYYIYKFGVVKKTAEILKSNYRIKKGSYANNIRDFYKLYDEICEELCKDTEIRDLLDHHLTESCYSDPQLKTLTTDFGVYTSRYYLSNEMIEAADDNTYHMEYDSDFIEKDIMSEEWIPSLDEYSPGLSKEQWLDLFISKKLLGPFWGGVLAAFYDAGGAATCSQIAQKFGKSPSSISGLCTNLAKKIHKETNCPLTYGEDGNKKYWPILFQGKKAGSNIPGGFIWKLRTELYDALEEFGIMHYLWTDLDSKEPYTKEDFLNEVYMTEEKYNILASVIKNKKNIILQGAPGVGKTFAARRLAYSLMEEKDDERIEFVQFHQNYSYEDFMLGYRPDDEGFILKEGIFYRFCKVASENPDENYYFIIDEINRGNLSKIFGELLMLIEKEYRGTEITLSYNGESFFVPDNLYIIGMMNTADRSLAMIDYALRRRFSFFEMEPGFDTDGFIKYQNGLASETFDELIMKIKDLNTEISNDKSLGKGFCIGHSYFCNKNICSDEWLQEVVDYDIIPMLSEYWFDDSDKLKKWENILHGVFQ